MPRYEAFEESGPCNDAELAARLATLWPHRWHESNWLKNLFCHFGLHSWQQLYRMNCFQIDGK
jgi:hypothetical protein